MRQILVTLGLGLAVGWIFMAIPVSSPAADTPKPQSTSQPTSAPSDADQGLTEGGVEFNSKLAFEIWICDGLGARALWRTPGDHPWAIPKCWWWAVEPLAGVRLADVVAEGKAQGIRGLKLERASDDDLAQLGGWTTLQTLDLSQTKITDAGLANIKDLKALRTLDLENTRISDAGAAYLKELNALQTLNLVGTRITDAGLIHVKKLKQLRTIYLPSRITDAGLADLRKAMPNTRINP